MFGTMEEENKKKWSMSLSALQCSYNTTVHATTRYSLFLHHVWKTPSFGWRYCSGYINKDVVYKIEYIREVRRYLQTAYLKCKEAILKSKNKNKGYYDKNLPIIRKTGIRRCGSHTESYCDV